MTPVVMISWRLGGCSSTMNVLCEHRVDGYCLLHQSVKQLATGTGCSPVEPEGVFIKVVVQMRNLNPTLPPYYTSGGYWSQVDMPKI